MMSEMDKSVKKFGGKTKLMRRQSSTEWEIPSGEAGKFARVKNTPEGFKARINLGYFSEYKPEEIQVHVHEYDLHIHGEQDEPTVPNLPVRRFSRQYRLPDDTDLATVNLKRSGTGVDVTAKKVDRMFGKDVQLHVVDVTQHRPTAPVS